VLTQIKNAAPAYSSELAMLPSDGKRVEFHGP
jgi:hypothetical protein